ncbi:MAG: hypothetical protein OXC46_01225 [Thaumarchaeota archaeon]|nr:hypothetical protein [Nitrososphaerota archaeon]
MIDLNKLYSVFDRAISVHRYNGHVLVELNHLSETDMDKLKSNNILIVSIMSTPSVNKFAVELDVKE